jgi:UDP-N-acetylglucosamine--N-acetylmuramyl-(pentapeptide) pyrophosphoryl-undecaprenol N-acetylglucosamine transferase
VAGELRARGADVEFAGAGRIESRMVPEAGYPFHRFEVRGFDRRPSPALLRSLLVAGKAPVDCIRIVRRVRPDVVFGAGGYVSGPMLLAARAARLPAALLEVDAHMGLANRLAVPLVQRVYLAFPLAGRKGEKYRVTGRPVLPPAGTPGGTAPAGDVVVFGGSLGSTSMNRAASQAWAADDPSYRIVHITGEREHHLYAGAARPWYRVERFVERAEFDRLLREARLVVARAGGSVFEIAAAGRPALLIPSPHVTADHQTANARHFVAGGAAVLLPDAELTGERLRVEVETLLGDPQGLSRMSEAALRLARPNAAAEIADDLLTLAG